ncbi:7274_t:CDS:2 [Funneliformis mosseae]|uniref:7274_t:CDS:1 n=1 Tax=Funneliformis mosseae TaxID=27381 RepID=A0A9N9FQC2_FUNMO|nr:7274_t:CDS:2 [Funneliformis mosseae]
MSYPDKTELDRGILNQGKSFLSISWKIFSNVHIAENWYKNLFLAWKALKSIKRGELEPYYDGIQSCKDTQNFGNEFECDLNVIKFQSTDTSRYDLNEKYYFQCFKRIGASEWHLLKDYSMRKLIPWQERISKEYNISLDPYLMRI